MEQDYYKILGVGRNASKAEIKVAYKKRALQCHPDKFTSASEIVKAQKTREFQLLNEAYSCLYDAKSRRIYDASYTYENWQGSYHARRPAYTRRNYPSSQRNKDIPVWPFIGIGLIVAFGILWGIGRKRAH